MGIGGWAERRFAGQAAVDLPSPRPAQRSVVVGRELHHEVVRLLAIVDRVALADLTRGEVVQRPAVRNRPRLGAQHRAHADSAGADLPARHEHPPVDAACLSGRGAAGPMAFARFIDQLRKHGTVDPEIPAAPLAMDAVHRRGQWQPRRARDIRGRRQERPRDLHVLVDLRGARRRPGLLRQRRAGAHEQCDARHGDMMPCQAHVGGGAYAIRVEVCEQSSRSCLIRLSAHDPLPHPA